MTKKFTREIIGDCTIYLGDSKEIVHSLGIKADMIFTDPPYGHNNNDGDLIHAREAVLGQRDLISRVAAASRPIMNDGQDEASDLVKWLFQISNQILVSGGCCCCCCCGGGGPDPQFARWSIWMNKYLDFKQMIVWDKGPIGMGWHYRRSYETVLVGQKRGGACKWYDKSGTVENILRPGYFGIRKLIPQKDDHPTEKPMELARFFIQLHTQPDETVFDPFMGSGSTGVAAVETGRKFIGIELDQKWFDLACKRLDKSVKRPTFFYRPGQKLERKKKRASLIP